MSQRDDTLFLGIDVGTQSSKALVVDVAAGRVLGRGSAPHTMIAGLPAGHQEQAPQQWLQAVQQAVAAALTGIDRSRVAALAVSGQQHGCVVLDAEGAVLRPAKLWCDTATAAEAAELGARLGRPLPVGYTASKLLWLRRHEPATWQRIRTVLLPHDFVNLRLTGLAAMEAGDASGTGCFDPRQRCFDPAAIAAIDPQLAEWLPALRPAGELLGGLSADGARLLGLPAGLPVATGGGDNMMSAIGSGAVAPGVVTISLGTSGTIFARSDAPVLDPEGLIAPFCSSDGGWLPLLCVMNLTGVTEEVRLLTGRSHDELTALAQAEPWGAGGLCWLPYLLGERVPELPLATGSLLGLRPGSLRPGPLYRAAIEGCASNLLLGFDRLRRCLLPIERVHLVGGAAHNPLWQQVLADMLGLPVLPLREAESAALGAALQAAWAFGRSRGDHQPLHALVAPWLAGAPPVAPIPAHAAPAAACRAQFAAALQQLHPGTSV